MGDRPDIKERWQNLRNTEGFKNAMLFLAFLAVSAIFWFIMALNDSAQNHFSVGIRIVNKPDSVTFISDIPEKIHVSVSDKGTSLWRNGYLKKPTVNIDFKEYSNDGVLSYSYNDFITSLRQTFGTNAIINSISADSLKLYYTTNPGKTVPVYVNCEITPASGSIQEGSVKALPASVTLYGPKEVLDSVKYVSTQSLHLSGLTETTSIDVKLKRLPGTRAIPGEVQLTIPIEPLVVKQAMVTIEAENVPEGDEMLLFPSKVPVEYYVAMSRLNDDEDDNIKLVVDYEGIQHAHDGKLPVVIKDYPSRLKNLKLKSDSVEFAVVKE